jgi:ribonuclease PH
MTGSGHYVEVQSSGEESTFSRSELEALLELGAKGIDTIAGLQEQAISAALT